MKQKIKWHMPLNVLFLGIVFVFSVGYTYLAFQLPFGMLRSPGAGFIPRIVGGAASVLSAVLLLTDIKKTGEEEKGTLAYPRRFWWFLLAFIVYAIIFRPVGYVISTMLFTCFLCSVMGNRIWISVLIGVLTGISFYFVFSLLSVPLPMGILEGFGWL